MKNSLEEQIEADSKNILDYLNSVRENSNISEIVLQLAWQVWHKLSKQFLPFKKRLEVPNACPGSRNNFIYTWLENEHYLECEIFGSGAIELFYLNKKTEECLISPTTIDLWEFSPEILSKLEIFTERYLVKITSDRLGYEKTESQEVKPII